jgi:hypothetical protein
VRACVVACMYMYISMHACMHACMHECMLVFPIEQPQFCCTQVFTVNVCVFVCVYVCMYLDPQDAFAGTAVYLLQAGMSCISLCACMHVPSLACP